MSLKLTIFYQNAVQHVLDVPDRKTGEQKAIENAKYPNEATLLWDNAKDQNGSRLTGFEPDTWKFRAWFDAETQTTKTETNPHG